jgi:subtilase family serine protease
MMRLRRSFGYRCFSLLLAGSIAASVLGAQTVPGNFAQGRAESGTSGAATASVRLERMLLLLQGPGSQQTKLDTLLNAQQTVGNAQYHAWLTAAEFGQQFGPSAGDTAAVVGWLKAQGFRVAALPAGRQWIEFSGTLAQTEQAFGVRVTAVGARYQMTGQAQLPAGIAAQVAGLVSLDGELAAAAATIPVASSEDARALVATAGVAAGALTGPIPPAAASALLKRSGLAAEWNGQGETIAIPSRSAIAPEDVAAFRDSFGLAANEVELSTAAQKTAVDRTGDEAATLLAASWAGVTAPGARILVVPAATTNATDGLDLALAATVDGELAHTVTVGYTACESGLSAAHGAFYAAVYQQAAAEGIAVVAATGDSGAAACHVGGDSAPVTTGYGVNALAATPWNTAVGAAATLDGKAAGWGQATATDAAYATGGGVSQVYARPGWQAAEGVPASDPAGDTASGVGSGHHRYLPDVVMPAAAGSASGLAYCYAGETGADGCWLVTGGGSAGAAAMFAG